MKVLKYIVFGLIGLVLLVVVAGFLCPRELYVSRSIRVKAPTKRVYSKLSNLHAFLKWSPWVEADPKAIYTFEGPESGVGSKMKWSSKVHEVGSGSMLILSTTPETRVDVELSFVGSENKGKSWFEITPTGDSTQVTWSMKMDIGNNPIMRLMVYWMADEGGKDYDKGLVKFKTFIESIPSYADIVVREVTLPDQLIMSKRLKLRTEEVYTTLGPHFGAIKAVMAEQKLSEVTQPAVYFHKYDPNGESDVEAVMFIDKPGVTVGNITYGTMKGSKVVVAEVKGDYENLQYAHEAIREWLHEHGLPLKVAHWEQFVVTPFTEKDKSKLVTRVYYPI
jgi:effector-binding domain-containing protein/uncharacterized membrane protein